MIGGAHGNTHGFQDSLLGAFGPFRRGWGLAFGRTGPEAESPPAGLGPEAGQWQG